MSPASPCDSRVWIHARRHWSIAPPRYAMPECGVDPNRLRRPHPIPERRSRPRAPPLLLPRSFAARPRRSTPDQARPALPPTASTTKSRARRRATIPRCSSACVLHGAPPSSLPRSSPPKRRRARRPRLSRRAHPRDRAHRHHRWRGPLRRAPRPLSQPRVEPSDPPRERERSRRRPTGPSCSSAFEHARASSPPHASARFSRRAPRRAPDVFRPAERSAVRASLEQPSIGWHAAPRPRRARARSGTASLALSTARSAQRRDRRRGTFKRRLL